MNRISPLAISSPLAMATPPFVAAVQRRTASVAVGASTVRGIGPADTAARARAHLAKLDLDKFCQPTEHRLRNTLDRETLALMRSLPDGGRYWGLARKLLNIYMRDALYNKYLSKHYRLSAIERWLEVPLDSHVGKRLRSEFPGSPLPAWRTIKGLTPELSAVFQSAARVIASDRGIAAVHLDLFYWRAGG